MLQSHIKYWPQNVYKEATKITVIIIIIIIVDKTDAGLNGLCIRDITLIYDVINTYNNY